MKVAVAAGARFHVLDLARELHALGHEVTFYSYLPRARASRFGLPDSCQVSLFPVMAPMLAAERVVSARLAPALSHARMTLLDHVVARILRPCDVLVAMSGLFVATLHAAKRKYAAAVVVERGSRHILSQDRILRDMPGGEGADAFSIPRELASYELADFISVPSRHAAESFLAAGVPERKLLVNPYGCDLTMFPPTPRSGVRHPTLLFVGTWCLRKGCDVLVQAWRSLDHVRLVHVGAVGDLSLPADAGFTHVDPVPQQDLSGFYADADVFVLASREEGLALVQAQALASGLPVVCTARTGGVDLRDLVRCGDAVIEVPPDDPERLASAIRRAIDHAATMNTKSPRKLVDDLTPLSWRAYGERYDGLLRAALDGQAALPR